VSILDLGVQRSRSSDEEARLVPADAAYMRLYRARKSAHEICSECNEPAVPGRKKCRRHLASARKRQKKYERGA
jgi:hypothetical protein